MCILSSKKNHYRNSKHTLCSVYSCKTIHVLLLHAYVFLKSTLGKEQGLGVSKTLTFANTLANISYCTQVCIRNVSFTIFCRLFCSNWLPSDPTGIHHSLVKGCNDSYVRPLPLCYDTTKSQEPKPRTHSGLSSSQKGPWWLLIENLSIIQCVKLCYAWAIYKTAVTLCSWIMETDMPQLGQGI